MLLEGLRVQQTPRPFFKRAPLQGRKEQWWDEGKDEDKDEAMTELLLCTGKHQPARRKTNIQKALPLK